MDPVTILITNDGKTIQIPWRGDMNVQEALETAFDHERNAGRNLNFALQYFGYFNNEYLGYLVTMIDGIYDNPNDSNDYWIFKVNGRPSPVGIDSLMVNAGDEIEFNYQSTVTVHHLQVDAKKDFYLIK